MTITQIKQLVHDKDIAAYEVVGCAREFLKLNKSGLQYVLPWDTMEKYLDKFDVLEKELKSALNEEVAA